MVLKYVQERERVNIQGLVLFFIYCFFIFIFWQGRRGGGGCSAEANRAWFILFFLPWISLTRA